MPATLARIEANRRNALKSTGPRTPAGKARSRENGLKHGLTGEGVVIDAQSRSEVDARKARLLEQLCPSTELGEILVDRIAVLSVRLERSSRADEASTTLRVRDARGAFDDAREHEQLRLERALMRFGKEAIDEPPAVVVRKLCLTRAGVDGLIGQWRWLRESVEKSVPGAKYGEPGWQDAKIEAERFDYLSGLYPDRVSPSPTYAAALKLNGGDAAMKPALCKFIDEAIGRLESLRASIDPHEPEIGRSEAAEIALFDRSKEGELQRRYEARTENALFRAIRELRIAERAAKVEADSEASPDDASRKSKKPNAPRPNLAIADPDAPTFVDVSASAVEAEIPPHERPTVDYDDGLQEERARLIALERLGREGLDEDQILERELARVEANLPVIDHAAWS